MYCDADVYLFDSHIKDGNGFALLFDASVLIKFSTLIYVHGCIRQPI